MRVIFLCIFSLMILLVHSQTVETNKSKIDTNLTLVNSTELKNIIDNGKDKLLVINYWATWCVPCIKELPDLMAINEKYKELPNYKMILVSLDRVKSEENVNFFLQKQAINLEVYLLSDIKNIKNIEPDWIDAIPTTAIYKNGRKIFFQSEIIEKEVLDKFIKENLHIKLIKTSI